MSEKHIGKVIQVTGPVLDIRFKEGELPALLNAIEINIDGRRLIAEVAQQIGDDVVRCIAMSSTDGLVRGIDAVDTEGPITVPVGEECSIPIWINCIGKTNPLSANSFEVSADSAEFTYRLSPKQTVLNPLFVITCKFDTAGEFELRIAAGDISDTKTVVVS